MSAFITDHNTQLVTPSALCTKLTNYPRVGIEIYGRRSNKPPSRMFINSTIFQLIVSGILKIKMIVVGDKMTATLNLNVIDSIGTMACHCDSHWNGIMQN